MSGLRKGFRPRPIDFGRQMPVVRAQSELEVNDEGNLVPKKDLVFNPLEDDALLGGGDDEVILGLPVGSGAPLPLSLPPAPPPARGSCARLLFKACWIQPGGLQGDIRRIWPLGTGSRRSSVGSLSHAEKCLSRIWRRSRS